MIYFFLWFGFLGSGIWDLFLHWGVKGRFESYGAVVLEDLVEFIVERLELGVESIEPGIHFSLNPKEILIGIIDPGDGDRDVPINFIELFL